MAFSRLDIKLNILPFDVPSVAKSFSERLKKFFWTRNAGSEDTDRWFCFFGQTLLRKSCGAR